MHISKLEICGFKSFVDRTVVHFDHDLIGVVGPNGCGKSNVVDAIRWVMGEQSAKALRGKAMGDVIFNGSESRPQAGFAEVTITFDNNDPATAQQLPLEYRDYSHIAVTRRVYRGDGNNDYFINKVPVRLRDVTEVFLGTGVGRKAYSIVEQGKIGMIVSARPEDRRVLIEEAAGITKYKARKRQAENKMNLTRQNLARVADIVSEIARQLGSLKRQAAKAHRFLRYRKELDDLVLWEASHKLLELVTSTTVATEAAAECAAKVDTERTSVDARDAEIEVMRQNTLAAEQQAERTQNAAFLSDNDVREEQTRIERASDRLESLDGRLAQARDEQRELEHKAGSVTEERDGLQAQLATIEQEQEQQRERVQTESLKLDADREQADEAEERLAELRHNEADAAAAIARGEAEADGFAQRAVEMSQRHERLDVEHARLTGEHAGLSIKREELARKVRELVSRKHAMCDARDALGQELPALRQMVSEGDRELEELRGELHRRNGRRRALEELVERMEGLGDGVRNLLSTGDDSLRGVIAERIEVPAEYTTAVAGLVGDRLQCVVVSDLDRALELLRGLADDKRGRATVIPQTVVTNSTAPATLHHRSGVIGLVAEQLRYAPEDEGIVRSLVGDAVLVRDDDEARQLQSHGLGCDMVTLAGTVFYADGRVTGGAGDALTSGMLDHRREMRELTELVGTLREQVATAEGDAEEQRARLAKLHDALDEAKSEAHEAEITMVTGEQDLQRLDQQLTIVAARRTEVAREVEEIDGAIIAARAEHDQSVAALALGREKRERASAELVEAERQALACRQQLSQQQATYTERKVQLASVSERAGACRAALERLEREHDELIERIDSLETERLRCATEAGEIAADLYSAREELLDAKTRAREAHAAFENARLGLDDARHSLGLREAELREMRAALEELNASLQQHQMQLQRLELEREHLDETIRDRFRGLELKTVVGDYHARALVGEEERARIGQLTQLIDRMGSVNLDAVQELADASERYTFFTEQQADLERALGDLEKAIAQMNRESKRLFKHAFEGINRRFKEIFPKMFRGGKAELRLTDPSDMLETGIEILAQPPGKRLGNIELMSGGEKAFTAVSLLLSIFRFKPSPFCILDEVDAPLDDANVDRYVEGIRAMTDRSQFIVITHSKRTMQAVDVLYGITMQEPGVSKLVGVRVNDAAARSERKTSMPPLADEEVEVVKAEAQEPEAAETEAAEAEAEATETTAVA